MRLRVARHTTALQPLINFYTMVLGLEVMGEFKDHNNYDGVFIGAKNPAWHLEFTVSNAPPEHYADEDDLLVFYAESAEQYDKIKENIIARNIPQATSKNPYWKENGLTIIDPDGFIVVITLDKD